MSEEFDREEYEANLRRLYGRQTGIEHMIEVFFANYFATLPEENIDAVARELRLTGRTLTFPPGTDHDEARTMAIEAVSAIDRTIGKAMVRAEGYRARQAVQPANGNDDRGGE